MMPRGCDAAWLLGLLRHGRMVCLPQERPIIERIVAAVERARQP